MNNKEDKLKEYIYRRCHIIYCRAFGNSTVNDQSEEEILTTGETKNICKFINSHYISRDKVKECIEQAKDDMAGLYDYDLIAKNIIDLLKDDN